MRKNERPFMGKKKGPEYFGGQERKNRGKSFNRCHCLTFFLFYFHFKHFFILVRCSSLYFLNFLSCFIFWVPLSYFILEVPILLYFQVPLYCFIFLGSYFTLLSGFFYPILFCYLVSFILFYFAIPLLYLSS